MKIALKGLVVIELLKDGKVIDRIKNRNLVLQSSENIFCNLIAGANQANNTITSIALGTGNTPPKITDTALENEVARVPVTGYTFLSTNSVEFDALVDQNTASGNVIQELGLYTAGNVLFARTVLTTPINKDSTFSFNIKWILNISLASA
ncbi:MAG: hypothetical protein DSY42_00305 [Aquifex sp.]|nr:MAG: hypothetical protein DSY42_00305 [Aquifex sp.]